jgi:hypothetical protein
LSSAGQIKVKNCEGGNERRRISVPGRKSFVEWLAFVCQLSGLRITEFAYEALEPDFLKAGFRFQRGDEVARSG